MLASFEQAFKVLNNDLFLGISQYPGVNLCFYLFLPVRVATQLAPPVYVVHVDDTT